MPEPTIYSRSPTLMAAGDTALLVVDVQEKLIPLVFNHRQVVWNIRRLLDGAAVLGVPVLGTEQYPHGLGPTVTELAQRIDRCDEKQAFSCLGCKETAEALAALEVHKVLIVGIEAHVCVAQTGHDLLAAGYDVYLAVDAVGSRGRLDAETALRRLDSAGATLTTTEAALFEWCEVSGTPQFKQISQLIKEPAPE